MSWSFDDFDGGFAAPISSPPFTFSRSGGLKVNRYARCAGSRLYDLLTYVDPGPVLTKKGKPRVHQPPPHQDETAAFYEAQLVHYGLKPLKTKLAAKNALLVSLKANNRTLTVPEGILKLERELAAQFEAKNAVARKEYHAQREREREAEEVKRKKRKREEEDLIAEFRKPTSKKAKSNQPSTPLSLTELCGAYTIVAPQVTDGWDCNAPLTLQLAPSSTGSHLWGSFNFGVFEGTLRSRSALPAINNKVKFHWRGRETGEGETTYGPENIAEFEFLGDGKFFGTMYWDCLGKFNLMGKLNAVTTRSRDFSRDVPKLKEEYWSINDASYERARVGRWGGWGGYEDEEREPNSDTDGPSEDRDSDGDSDGDEEGSEHEVEEQSDDGECAF